MNGTLIGMKSMDEGKHDIVCTICRFLTSYNWPSLQPGMSLRRLRDIIFDILRMNMSIEFIVGGET